MQPFDPIGDGEDPFEGIPPFLGDISRLFSSTGSLNFDVARQAAVWAATEGEPESNVDPLERIRIEDLLRVAELHVGNLTGLATSKGGILQADTLTRAEAAQRTLDDYSDWLQTLGDRLTGGFDELAGEQLSVDDLPPGMFDTSDPELRETLNNMLSNMSQVLKPALIGIQSGMMAGHLAHRGFGAYDLPLPRPPQDILAFIPANIGAFAHDWSLPEDDLRLWVCLSQLTHHAVLNIDHVAHRIDELVREYVSGFAGETDVLEKHLGDIDPGDPSTIQLVFDDPNAILGAIQTPGQQHSYQHLQAIIAALEGYVDYVVEQTGKELIGSYGQLTEALLRRRVEENDGERFVEKLFGLSMGQELFDKGTAFVNGVIERADPDALNRLWSAEGNLPTPNEIEAPGLWLARIDLPTEA